MHNDCVIRIVLEEHGVKTDDVRIEGADALLGSASHCHVRLSPDKLAPEQLRFEVRDGTLLALVRARHPAVTADGQPFRGGRLPHDTALRIGTLEVRANLERRAGASDTSSRPRPLLLAAAVIAVCGALFWATTRHGRERSAPPLAPALFAALAETCPEQAPEAARAAALEFLRTADAKRERAPFAPEDGLAAVTSYRRTAQCAERAGDAPLAEAARRRADALQAQVERDYHVHQVRVHLAQRKADPALLAREARVLASYVRGRSGRYGEWLDQLQREIDAETKKREVKR